MTVSRRDRPGALDIERLIFDTRREWPGDCTPTDQDRTVKVVMLVYLYVAIGGAIGSVARFAIGGAIARGVHEVFPWGTLIVNITGCFVIGLFAILTGPDGRLAVSPEFRQLFMVGICGGYTTFSSFSLQTLTLARDGDITRASLNVVASVAFCLIGVWLGAVAAAALNNMKGA